MVGLGRLELPTSRLSGVRSNQAELQALNACLRSKMSRKRNEDGGNPALVWRLIPSKYGFRLLF